jgi:hypothetical protein
MIGKMGGKPQQNKWATRKRKRKRKNMTKMKKNWMKGRGMTKTMVQEIRQDRQNEKHSPQFPKKE